MAANGGSPRGSREAGEPCCPSGRDRASEERSGHSALDSAHSSRRSGGSTLRPLPSTRLLRKGEWTRPSASRESAVPSEPARTADVGSRRNGRGGGHRDGHGRGPIRADDCVLDLVRCRASRGGSSARLTRRECAILRWLHAHRPRAVSRSELLEEVWGVPGNLRTRTVDMTISNLRRKIEVDPAQPRIVVTVKGTGYAWGGG